tara:strand:+ start:5054 stop:5566 length:513 start_codon:yes stop_codon:yes gene_type:complete
MIHDWLILALEIMGIVLAFVGTLIMIAIVRAFLRPMTSKLKNPLKGIRRTRMSKEAREGVTFNDIFMFMIAVPLVLLWVGFAGFVIHTGLNNSSVLDNIEAYTTLIAILGGPALLIIKDALDVWKQEQAEKTAFYQVKAQSVIDFNKSTQNQAQLMESNEQAHVHKVNKK